MNGPRTVRLYRGLLRCYPRRFRDEYRADMALLFADQLRDEPASRVWARGVVDLAITIPARHLEAHMDRPPNPVVPLVFAAITVTGIVFGIVVGPNVGIAAFGLVVAAVAGVLTVASWRHTRALTSDRPATARWWQVLLGGAAMLTPTIIVLNVVGELPDAWWGPMMLTLLAGILTTAAGIILGIAHLASNRPRSATS